MARSTTHRGWRYDAENSRLEFYFNDLKIGHLDASGFTITDGSTTYLSNNLVQNSGIATGLKTHVARLGSTAAVASNGAGAILENMMFVAPAALKVVSAWRVNISASDVTKGTATSSASYRRMNLIANTAAAGSGTTIVASLNATASAASKVARSFAAVAGLTVPAGGIILASHLTVGAETGDGTDMAANIVEIAYELV